LGRSSPQALSRSALLKVKRALLKLIALQQEVRDRARAADLTCFVHAAWPILEPATQLKWNWHLDLICDHLTAVAKGQIRRLIVNVPPRSMKSLLCTVFYPVWRWCTEPQRRFMFVSYSEELSSDHSVFRRNVLSSEMYRNGCGRGVRFSKDQNLKTQYENTKRGVMFSTSIFGSATGKGCDELIVDDPMNARKAFSDPERETTNRNFDATFRSRLNDPATGAIIVIMQRLHDEDLTGHLLNREPNVWTHLKLPAEFEHEQTWISPVSGDSITRQAGQLLWEERFSRRVLDDLKTALGSWAYAGQYQQDPAPRAGGIIQRDWLKYYGELPAATGSFRWLQSWDCSFKDTSESDYVVGQVWLRVDAAYYLVDQVRERMDFVRTRQAIQQMTARYPQATAKLIENKANGPAVIASLRSEIDGIIPYDPVDPKIGRLNSVSPLFEAKNIWLPEPSRAPWVGDFVEELTRFPKAAHDDQVDACTQALMYMCEQRRGLEEFRRQMGDAGIG
jgi:predicted phage terminase large subunit-like protein